MCKERPRVLVAGGCHVHAYPIGEQYSFGRLAAAAVGWDYAAVSKVSLRNPSALLQHLENHETPDAVVLQLGNYEAPYPLPRHAQQIFPRLLKPWKQAAGSSSSPRWYSAPDPEASFKWSPLWRLRIGVKQVYAALAQHANPPLSDTAAMARNLSALLQKLEQMGVQRIVVISPLPCADYMACGFRLSATRVFAPICMNAKVILMDSGAVLGYRGTSLRHSFDIYADERHLNLRGHRLLAEALAPELARLGKSMSAESAVEGLIA